MAVLAVVTTYLMIILAATELFWFVPRAISYETTALVSNFMYLYKGKYENGCWFS